MLNSPPPPPHPKSNDQHYTLKRRDRTTANQIGIRTVSMAAVGKVNVILRDANQIGIRTVSMAAVGKVYVILRDS